MIDSQSAEVKQLKSTIKSQETSIAYFKREIDEVNAQLDKERQEKLQLKTTLALGLNSKRP